MIFRLEIPSQSIRQSIQYNIPAEMFAIYSGCTRIRDDRLASEEVICNLTSETDVSGSACCFILIRNVKFRQQINAITSLYFERVIREAS